MHFSGRMGPSSQDLALPGSSFRMTLSWLPLALVNAGETRETRAPPPCLEPQHWQLKLGNSSHCQTSRYLCTELIKKQTLRHLNKISNLWLCKKSMQFNLDFLRSAAASQHLLFPCITCSSEGTADLSSVCKVGWSPWNEWPSKEAQNLQMKLSPRNLSLASAHGFLSLYRFHFPNGRLQN